MSDGGYVGKGDTSAVEVDELDGSPVKHYLITVTTINREVDYSDYHGDEVYHCVVPAVYVGWVIGYATTSTDDFDGSVASEVTFVDAKLYIAVHGIIVCELSFDPGGVVHARTVLESEIVGSGAE